MKTVNVNGKRLNVTYRTNTEMLTKLSKEGFKTTQYGADVYNIDGFDGVAIVATAQNGATLQSTVKVISDEDYEAILELHDPYNASEYHFAIMNELGFN